MVLFFVDLLFGVLPIDRVGSVFVFVLLYITLCPFLVCNHFEKEGRELDALFFIVLWMSCYCKYSVTLSHAVVCLSEVCDCGIS